MFFEPCDLPNETVDDAFRLALRESKIKHYALKVADSLSEYLLRVWKVHKAIEPIKSFSKVTKKVIVYWTSVFHEKGVLRASILPHENKIEKRRKDFEDEFGLMQNLMVITPDTPRHLLTFLMEEKKGSAELVKSKVNPLLDNGDNHRIFKLKRDITKKEKGKLKRELYEKVIKGDYQAVTMPPELKGIVKLDGNIKVLMHPLYQIAEYKYGRILYLPIDLGGMMFAGVVLGLRSDNITQLNIEHIKSLKDTLLYTFLYPIHSIEARATAIPSPPISNLYFPENGFDAEVTFKCDALGDGKVEGYLNLIEKIESQVRNKVVKEFMESLIAYFTRKDIEAKPMPFWDYTEIIFWHLFDASEQIVRGPKKSADLLRSREALQHSVQGPMALICRALDNELPLQELAGYRDHFAHTFHVFLLGLFLLHCGKHPFNETTAINCGKIEKAWWWASLFHDIAYGIEKLETLANKYLKRMIGEKEPPHDSDHKGDFTINIPMNSHWGVILTPARFIKAFDRLVKSFSELSSKNDRAELRSILHKALMTTTPDHGVVSAFLLEYSFLTSEALSIWRENKSNKTLINQAVSAIALHNAPTWVKKGLITTKKAIFLKDLFSDSAMIRKLLICCDELACMGRQKTEKYRTVKMKNLDVMDNRVTGQYDKEPWIIDIDKYPKDEIDTLLKMTLIVKQGINS